MTHSFVRAAVAAALTVSLASGSFAQAPSPMNAEQGWNAVGRCAARNSERARHDCIDEVLRQAGLLTPQAEATERRRQFGLDTESARAAATPPPPASTRTPDTPKPAAAAAPPSPAPRPAAPATPPKPADTVPDRLQVQLASAVTGLDGKVVLTTTDGAVWRQTDSDSIPRLPAAGAQVNIRKAALGSYLCELPTRHTFRCIRAK